MLAVAEQLVEHHADREEVGRHVPAREVGIGRLVRRRARLRATGSPTREAMLKSSSFAPVRVSMTLRGLMSRCTRPLS